MKRNLLRFEWPFRKARNTTGKSFEIPPGGCALIFTDTKTYETIIDGLADAQLWTGYNYPRLLNEATFISRTA